MSSRLNRTLLLVSGAALIGCAPSPLSSSSKSPSATPSTPAVSSPTRGEGIVKSSLVLANTDDYLEMDNCPSTGEQKVLVVPCRFEGEPEFDDDILSKLNRAFFDEDLSEEDGCYYSVAEFYRQSSYGALTLSGEVLEVVDIPYTVEEAEKVSSYLPGLPAEQLALSELSDEKLREYDLNHDGYVDSACFIYSSPMDSRTGSFWAWTATFATEPNLERPSFRRHLWCGIEKVSNDDYEIDAHTLVHEMGHVFGLRDYYPSDNMNLSLGGHSMMDYNISDHDPYSKMLLGWLDPLYYDFKPGQSLTLDLKPLQSGNEALLLNTNWNHTVMDEYLLIEYYTPDGLNALDAEKAYDTRPQGFTKPGLKVYHVDSRIAECHFDEAGDGVFDRYVDAIPEDKGESFYLIGANANNVDSYTDASRVGRYKQIQLVENKTVNRLQSGYPADDDSLFYEGDVFDSAACPAYISNGLFNNGEEIGFTIAVNSLGETANLTITYEGK